MQIEASNGYSKLPCLADKDRDLSHFSDRKKFFVIWKRVIPELACMGVEEGVNQFMMRGKVGERVFLKTVCDGSRRPEALKKEASQEIEQIRFIR